MRCSIKDCYWNMYREDSRMFNTESSLQCVSESLAEHYDDFDSFEVTPNSRKCEGYLAESEYFGE